MAISSSQTHSNKPRRIGNALAFYAFIAIGVTEAGLGVLIPSIQKTFNLTPATIALLFLSHLIGYVFAALASSLVSNRIGLARMLLLASVSLTSALVIQAIAPTWMAFIAAGTLLGLGIGLIDAGINTFVVNNRGSANLTGLLHAFYGVGALSSPAVATTLLSFQMSWRTIQLMFAAVVGLVVIGMLWAVLTNYTPLNQRIKTSDASAAACVRTALTKPVVLMAGLLSVSAVGIEASIGNWAFSVQSVGRNTPEMLAGYSLSAYWIGMTLARVAMGRTIGKFGAVRTLNGCLALLTAGLLIWWLLPNQLWGLPIIGLGLGAIFPATVYLMPQRVPAQAVPAAIGFLTSVASLGAALIPTGVGWIADRRGLQIIPALLVPLAVSMVVLHRWLVKHEQTQSDRSSH
jgi:fucose permease